MPKQHTICLAHASSYHLSIRSLLYIHAIEEWTEYTKGMLHDMLEMLPVFLLRALEMACVCVCGALSHVCVWCLVSCMCTPPCLMYVHLCLSNKAAVKTLRVYVSLL